MMMPVGRLVLLRSVAKEDMVAAMSWLLVPALIGPIIGPPVGGFIVTYLNWRWIFYLNLPIGLLGVVLVTCSSRRCAGETAPRGPDFPASCCRGCRWAACCSASR